MQQQILKSARYPNLQTVLMVEKVIKDNSMFCTQRQIFNKLPKSMQWGTFKIIIDYLESTLKIMIEKNNPKYISYIWNPQLLEKIKDMPDIRV